jgi:hypothetical protein
MLGLWPVLNYKPDGTGTKAYSLFKGRFLALREGKRQSSTGKPLYRRKGSLW